MANDLLDDNLGDIFGDFGREMDAAKADRNEVMPVSKAEAPMFSEKCKSCRGSGKFISYTGRTVGSCFKCKGTGTIVYKMSPEKRAAGRAYAQKRKDAKVAEVRASADNYAETHVEVVAWLNANTNFEFACSLREALNRFGRLTEGQENAVLRIIEKNKVRDAERAAEKAAREASAPTVSIEKIEESFLSAKSKGIKRPKLRLGDFKFSLAPDTGRNAGAIYVKNTADDAYLGKVQGGKFLRVRDCSLDQEKNVLEICADPMAAAVAYGKRYGSCSCCGRELSNHASIDLGIGPICAEKYGW